jgi:uncharacterized protein
MTNAPDQQIEWSSGAQMESPCTKVCTIDETTGLCAGCGRTRGEIASWTSLSSAERRAIMAALPQRLNAM